MPKWDEARPKHGIVLLSGAELLLCSCGEEIRLAGQDLALTKDRRNDALLDRHKLHRERQEKKRK